MANEGTTRYYSDMHEKSVCKALGAFQQPNSGAGLFKKGDVIKKEASLLIECKTSMKDKDSVSVKKSEWIDKNKEEAFSLRMHSSCVCFNFGPGKDNYYIIDENLMKILVCALSENDDFL